MKSPAEYALGREVHAEELGLRAVKVGPNRYRVRSEHADKGYGPYFVTVHEDSGTLWAECTCKAGTQFEFMYEPCKHAGAVFLRLERRHEAFNRGGFWYSHAQPQLRLEPNTDSIFPGVPDVAP